MITSIMIPFLVFYFFLILSLLPSIISADNKPKFHPKCPPFDCGSIGKVHFPFSNISHPECGLYAINCEGPTPKINLKGGKSYDVINIFYNETIVILDKVPHHQLLPKNCNFLNNSSILPPVSPSISFELKSPNFILIKCHKHNPYTRLSLGNISVAHWTYEGCEDDYVIYYRYPEQLKLSELPDSHIPYCSVVQLPLIHPPPKQEAWNNDPFSLLTAELSLEWNVSDDCFKCFLDEEGQCLTNNSTQQFYCSMPENGKKVSIPKKVAIGAGVGATAALAIMLVVLFFLYRHWRRKNHPDSSTLISRSISPDLSMNPDAEKGSSYFQTPIFTYKELEEATNNFDESKELGDGGYGTVYHGELRDGRVVAVKRLYENNCKRVEQFMNEVTILSLLRHKNLVTLYGCTSRHSRELLLVYEYVPNGTVADHLHGEQAKPGLVTWPTRMSIAIESAGALAYLHASDIIHRDVKTNNILLDNNFHVKVADFGLSRLFPTDVTHVSTAPQGTPGYVDPEYYQCYQLTDKSDVYSFGVVLIELISSKPAVDISRHRHEINLSNMAINKIHSDALHELVDSSLGFESDCSVARMITLVAELAFRCLQQDRDMRPTMSEVLEVLKGIEVEGSKVVKGVEVDIPAEDVRLLKNIEPLSPDSVTGKWPSVVSTPNTSS